MNYGYPDLDRVPPAVVELASRPYVDLDGTRFDSVAFPDGRARPDGHGESGAQALYRERYGHDLYVGMHRQVYIPFERLLSRDQRPLDYTVLLGWRSIDLARGRDGKIIVGARLIAYGDDPALGSARVQDFNVGPFTVCSGLNARKLKADPVPGGAALGPVYQPYEFNILLLRPLPIVAIWLRGADGNYFMRLEHPAPIEEVPGLQLFDEERFFSRIRTLAHNRQAPDARDPGGRPEPPG